MKKYLSLFAIFLTLMACTKEEYKEVENYTLPSVTMDSCVVASSNSFTAYMTVDKGESFFNHSLQLLVYDGIVCQGFPSLLLKPGTKLFE